MTHAAQGDTLRDMAHRKNAAAVALARLRNAMAAPGELSEQGRRGGLIGGPARAAKLSKARRRAIAKKAAAARWGKKAKD